MAQIVVRNIPEEAMIEFKKLAKEHGNSAENEIREWIVATVDGEVRRRRFLAASRRFMASFGDRVFSDSTELIREDRDR